MSHAQYYFSISGEFIAYRRFAGDPFLFGTTGKLIGWFPWRDNDVVNKHGDYLGTVVGDRFVRNMAQKYREYPGNPGFPTNKARVPVPVHRSHHHRPAGTYEDIAKSRLEPDLVPVW
jgi:hypothetical protein